MNKLQTVEMFRETCSNMFPLCIIETAYVQVMHIAILMLALNMHLSTYPYRSDIHEQSS